MNWCSRVSCSAGQRVVGLDGRAAEGTATETIGALVLQSYEPIVQYGEAEKDILLIVSHQIAAAIVAKRKENALQESESKFRAVAETSPTLILVWDGAAPVYANPATEKTSGYSRDELLRIDPWTLVREDFRQMLQDVAQSRLRGNPDPVNTNSQSSPKTAKSAGWD